MKKALLLISLIAVVLVSMCAQNPTGQFFRTANVNLIYESYDKIVDLSTMSQNINKEIIDMDKNLFKVWNEKEPFNTTNLKLLLDEEEKKAKELQEIIYEESDVISNFSGSTTLLTGDAKKYADEIIYNVRESQKYSENAVSDLLNAIRYRKLYLDSYDKGLPDKSLIEKSDSSIKSYDDNILKQREFMSKASDASARMFAIL
ncbi:MAG: hypothetical protein ACE5J4_00950 [Candidatus Aenigmatarchaeota archaeon]